MRRARRAASLVLRCRPLRSTHAAASIALHGIAGFPRPGRFRTGVIERRSGSSGEVLDRDRIRAVARRSQTPVDARGDVRVHKDPAAALDEQVAARAHVEIIVHDDGTQTIARHRIVVQIISRHAQQLPALKFGSRPDLLVRGRARAKRVLTRRRALGSARRRRAAARWPRTQSLRGRGNHAAFFAFFIGFGTLRCA